MRKLASIQRIEWLRPIEGRDRIELAGVLGWQVIVKNGEFHIGELCIYVEIDSILPEKPEFEFLRSKNFRIKTMKMAGVLSQGIVFPLDILPPDVIEKAAVGDDVTNILGITKWEPYAESAPEPKKKRSKWIMLMYRIPFLRPLARKLTSDRSKRNKWPDFIVKTDETRVQNMPWVFDDRSIEYQVTEKVDGQSGTFFVEKRLPGVYDFGVCSRNFRLAKPDSSSYWYVAKKYNMKQTLLNMMKQKFPNAKWIAIQGECVGPGIQGNKYKFKDRDLYCFNLIVDGTKLDNIKGREIAKEYGLQWVPTVDDYFRLPETLDDLLAFATSDSVFGNTLREGIVLRNYSRNISFKAVSNEFLMKWKE